MRVSERMADTENGGIVTEECLQELLDFFVKNAYKAKNVDRRVRSLWHCCGYKEGACGQWGSVQK